MLKGEWNGGKYGGAGRRTGKPRKSAAAKADHAAAQRHPCHVPQTPQSAPLVIVRVNPIHVLSYPRWTPYQHAQYMIDGEKGELPNTESELLTDLPVPEKFRERWQAAGGRRLGGSPVSLRHAWATDVACRELPGEEEHIRVIVSPHPLVSAVAFAPRGILSSRERMAREYCLRLMAAVEEDMCRKLFWVATSHWNTRAPHLHICIRGIDRAGKAIKVHPGYRRIGFENRARLVIAAFTKKEVA